MKKFQNLAAPWFLDLGFYCWIMCSLENEMSCNGAPECLRNPWMVFYTTGIAGLAKWFLYTTDRGENPKTPYRGQGLFAQLRLYFVEIGTQIPATWFKLLQYLICALGELRDIEHPSYKCLPHIWIRIFSDIDEKDQERSIANVEFTAGFRY